MGLYVDDAAVQEYLSAAVTRENCNESGGAIDPEALAGYIARGESLTNGTLRGVYVLPLVAPIDELVITCTLQNIHCIAARRRPEIYQGAKEICEAAAELRAEIRSGAAQLDHPLVSSVRVPGVDSLDSRCLEQTERNCCDDD